MHPPAYPARPPAGSQAAEDCPSVVPAALVLQSEVSQKEKDKYHILMHTYGILEKEMATHSSILASRIPWTVACQAPLYIGSQELDMS